MAARDVIIYGVGDTPNWGRAPQAPTVVTSITADASATVSFRAPSDVGSGAVTHWVVTPYIGATPQTATTTAVASASSITGSDGNTYVQVPATGLTNGSAHTFTVKARNAYGDSAESTASAANTPLSGLVFGDDFNGPAGGPIDPEWWIYTRCGYLAQSEVQGYSPDHCTLDGAGSLKLTAEHVNWTGPRYPSDPSYPGTIVQPWTTGSCQSNTRTFAPAAGNTMTFEVRMQVNTNGGNGYWPAPWLEGQDYLNAWKTDPAQVKNNDPGKAEIDIAEWFSTMPSSGYQNNVYTSGTYYQAASAGGIDLSLAQHVYSATWKPGVAIKFYRDGGLTNTDTTVLPAAGCRFFLLLYLQMVAGGPTNTESCYVDYFRVYDQNLG